MNKVYGTFEEAVSEGLILPIHKGGASIAEFNVEGLSERIVKKSAEGYIIDPSVSFWELAEDYAV